LGILTRADALAIAAEKGLDLVEVGSNAIPPVCRLQDFDKLRYARKKQREKSRKMSKKQDTKEIRLSPNTSENDVMVKVKQAIKFLRAGDKVKIQVKFVGREITHPELGKGILSRMVEELSPMAEIDLAPMFEGKKLQIVLKPIETKE
jgi:translation initiation factor IF-3